MIACSVEAIKLVGKYLNTTVGTVCYNTDKVLTTVLDKQNIEGFASIVLRLAAKSSAPLTQEQSFLGYQWLEHISMYANQAAANPVFAKSFLQGLNKALEKNTYLTGQFFTIVDVAAYYVLYPLLERLSVTEKESLLHLCRWSKHIQTQPREMKGRAPPLLGMLKDILILPHQLEKVKLTQPVVYHPQPFSFPKYPVIVYL